MRAGLCAAIVAASVLGCGTTFAACPSSKTRDCLVNLDLAPQISQDIVAGEHIAAPTEKGNPVEPIPSYTGPTIGAAPNLQRAPEIGYRWAIN